MSNIDYKALVIPEARARQASSASAAIVKAECAERITAVLDTYTLSNLHSALFVEELTSAQMAAFHKGQKWVRDMRRACRIALTDGTTPDWPEVPEDVAALAKAH